MLGYTYTYTCRSKHRLKKINYYETFQKTNKWKSEGKSQVVHLEFMTMKVQHLVTTEEEVVSVFLNQFPVGTDTNNRELKTWSLTWGPATPLYLYISHIYISYPFCVLLVQLGNIFWRPGLHQDVTQQGQPVWHLFVLLLSHHVAAKSRSCD